MCGQLRLLAIDLFATGERQHDLRREDVLGSELE